MHCFLYCSFLIIQNAHVWKLINIQTQQLMCAVLINYLQTYRQKINHSMRKTVSYFQILFEFYFGLALEMYVKLLYTVLMFAMNDLQFKKKKEFCKKRSSGCHFLINDDMQGLLMSLLISYEWTILHWDVNKYSTNQKIKLSLFQNR